jgi:hypothetical protein
LGSCPLSLQFCFSCSLSNKERGVTIKNPPAVRYDGYENWLKTLHCPTCSSEWFVCTSCSSTRSHIKDVSSLRAHHRRQHSQKRKKTIPKRTRLFLHQSIPNIKKEEEQLKQQDDEDGQNQKELQHVQHEPTTGLTFPDEPKSSNNVINCFEEEKSLIV